MVKLTDSDKAYIKQACKMIKFPVDMKEGAFLVPVDMLPEAKEDLNVRHIIRLFDFKIQSVIPGSIELKEIYNPTIRLSGQRPKVEPVQGLKTGDRFMIVSTQTLIEVKEATAKSVKIKYVDSLRADIVTTKEQVEKALSLGTWKTA